MKQKLEKQDVGFAQIKNEVLNDKNLSWKAKGLFAYLYSKPDDWDYSGDRIARDGREGRKSVYGSLKELEEKGYLHRTRLKTGKMGYRIYYQPNAQMRQEVAEPNDHFGQESKRPQAERGSISNTESITNREKESNKERGETSSPSLGVSKILSKEEYSPYHGSPMDYFRDEAKRRYHLSYLKYEEERDPRIKKQIKALVGILGKEIKPFIDWWFDGEGSWCNYDPNPCFTVSTYSQYVNREVNARNKMKAKGKGVIIG